MCRILTLAVVATLTPTAGCGYFSSGSVSDRPTPWLAKQRFDVRDGTDSTPQQDAIIRVLDSNQEHLQAGYAALALTAQPSAVAAFAGEHAGYIAAADLAGCPAEFRAAVARHAQAWRQFQSTLKRFPDAYEGAKFMTDLNHLFHNVAGQGHDLGGDVIDAVGRVNHTYGEQFTAAEGYGVVARKSD